MSGPTSFTLTIPGPPQGQGRARIGRGAGGRPMAFTDPKTRSYSQQVQGEWIAAGRPVLEVGPYDLIVQAGWVRPGSHFRADGVSLSAAGRRAPFPGKPDLDNVVKGVLDALVAVGAVPDDRHLVSLTAAKWWARTAEVTVVARSCERADVAA